MKLPGTGNFITGAVDNLRDEIEKGVDRPLGEHVAILGAITIISAGAFFGVHEIKSDHDCTPMPISDVHGASTGC